MIRAASLLVFAALAALLFTADGASPTLLGAKQAGDFLLLTVDGPDGEPRAMWQDVLESEAVVEVSGEDGKPTRRLLIGGTRVLSDVLREGEGFDPNWHRTAGSSLIRKLRSIVADEGLAIEIPALKKPAPKEPAPGGVNFEFSVGEGEGALAASIDGGPISERAGPRLEITQRSLLPPLVAIFLAILFRRPVLALLMGVIAGAFLVRSGEGAGLAASAGGALVDTVTVYLKGQLQDHARTEIILFVVFMLAMVGVITRAGGIRGVMNQIAGLARDARKTQIATWFMGLAIFFDDYANTILVGSTMRPLSDRFKVAREKLAYIVDSTAAPVAGVSILSTWIAFEVSTFSAQLPDAGLAPSDGYAIFLQTLPYRFYCWFTLIFVGFNVFTGRDFGPMLRAERRARAGKVLRDGATPLVGKAATELEAAEGTVAKASTALIPLALFLMTVLGMIVWVGALDIGLIERATSFPFVAAAGGHEGGWLEAATGILYAGSGNRPLMVGAIVGFASASLIAMTRGLPPLEVLRASANSIKAMFIAVVILYLAWMVGQTCEDLGTAEYLSATISEAIPYMVLPLILFLLAGVIAFSTGSSWSTMTILLPLVIGLSYDIGFASVAADTDPRAFGLTLMVICIGAVLEGAIFGDHCSPISDTTVMSSIACASDHIDHVRTQAPYAILTMLVALGIGYFPVTFLDVSPVLSLALGTGALVLILFLKGQRVDAPVDAGSAP